MAKKLTITCRLSPVGTLIPAAVPNSQIGGTAAVGAIDYQASPSLGRSIGVQPNVHDDEANVTPDAGVAINLILYGPPGTGLTFAMERRMNEAFEKGQVDEFVAFHSSYSGGYFVGGLRPVAAPGGHDLWVEFQTGPMWSRFLAN